jgi:hypothetical protein
VNAYVWIAIIIAAVFAYDALWRWWRANEWRRRRRDD